MSAAPHCPSHVAVPMREVEIPLSRFRVVSEDERTRRAVRKIYRCAVEGCPRVDWPRLQPDLADERACKHCGETMRGTTAIIGVPRCIPCGRIRAAKFTARRLRQLNALACACGCRKDRGAPYCAICFRALPESFLGGLETRFAAGFPMAYDRARAWLAQNTWPARRGPQPRGPRRRANRVARQNKKESSVTILGG
jgi:hypothetical protein